MTADFASSRQASPAQGYRAVRANGLIEHKGTYELGYAHSARQHRVEPELLEIAERWRPYRSLAAGYLFLSEFEAKPSS